MMHRDRLAASVPVAEAAHSTGWCEPRQRRGCGDRCCTNHAAERRARPSRKCVRNEVTAHFLRTRYGVERWTLPTTPDRGSSPTIRRRPLGYGGTGLREEGPGGQMRTGARFVAPPTRGARRWALRVTLRPQSLKGPTRPVSKAWKPGETPCIACHDFG